VNGGGGESKKGVDEPKRMHRLFFAKTLPTQGESR